MMRVAIAHSGGPYQERVREHLQARSGARVSAFQLPENLPLVVDDAEEFIPPGVAEAEVVIAIALHPNLLAELPHVMGKGAGKALLAPREDPGWVRPGLMGQVTRACARYGIESAFPKPFCCLEPVTPVIREFSEQYGVGKHEFELQCEDGRIVAASCPYGSACGLTEWVAEQVVGRPCDEALPDAVAELLHLRPCLASMALDEETGDTIMHRSIAIIKEAADRALTSCAQEATTR